MSIMTIAGDIIGRNRRRRDLVLDSDTTMDIMIEAISTDDPGPTTTTIEKKDMVVA